MKIIITESQRHKMYQRLRRISELKESIEFHFEVHDPCNFEDGENYADFCIDEAFCFFYRDQNCNDDYDEDYDEDEDEGDEVPKKYDIFDDEDYPEREELYNLLYEEYFFKIKEMWEEYSINCK